MSTDHPLHFNIDYPEKLSRGILILRLFFGWLYVGIPHFFILGFLGIAVGFVSFIAWWAILFTGKYPQGMFNFVVGYQRWMQRVMAYMGYMTDKYPPFSTKEVEGNPVHYNIDYPEKLSRGILILRLFFGALYCALPHYFILMFLAIAVGFISFIAWWAILFTGKYPQGMFNFVVNYNRWMLRVGAYMNYMTDKYPPFNGKE
ncbi:DUF4389 domain-containing protein [bacterium]|nr:DUF4389 domain-containing protein [bacterium]